MTTVPVPGPGGDVPVYTSRPDGGRPWPGVVVVHDALGMTTDLRRQADWLASEGYLAAAPDLYHSGGRLRCMFSTIRDALRRQGAVFDTLEAVRVWLVGLDDCTGRVGVIGFCLGGGVALLLAADRGFDASSVNYGSVPKDADALLSRACPIVGSYGARDWGLRHDPSRLDRALTTNGVPHDVRVYPDAGHSFLNDHERSETPVWAVVAGALSSSEYHEPSARDARRRISDFFAQHLRTPPTA